MGDGLVCPPFRKSQRTLASHSPPELALPNRQASTSEAVVPADNPHHRQDQERSWSVLETNPQATVHKPNWKRDTPI
jgi:hypothetical protein